MVQFVLGYTVLSCPVLSCPVLSSCLFIFYFFSILRSIYIFFYFLYLVSLLCFFRFEDVAGQEQCRMRKVRQRSGAPISPSGLAALWGVEEAVLQKGVMRRTVTAGGTSASVALNAAQVLLFFVLLFFWQWTVSGTPGGKTARIRYRAKSTSVVLNAA